MAIPKEPRALMIQLMYLVLTAMLALNITREVLNAFNTINSSIEKSNSTIDQKNATIYQLFEKAESRPEDREKAKPWHDKAKEVKQLSADMVAYIGMLKDTVIARGGGLVLDERTGEMVPNKMEDINVSTFYFVENDKKGDELKGKLQNYIDQLLSYIDNPTAREEFKSQIPIDLSDYKPNDDNKTGDWSRGTFNNIPIIGAITLLSKFQNDVKNAEGFIIENLYKNINAESILIDEYKVIAVPNISYALAGDEINATVTLAAYSKAIRPEISSSAGGSIEVKDGIGVIKFRAANSPGLQTVRGSVTVPFKGERKSYPYEFTYMVGSTGASLGLDKMNVFYIGVDNPVTVSASGYNIEDVKLTIPEATVKPTTEKSKYIVNVTTPNPVKGIPYTISAKDKSGVFKEISKGTIRVKTIPDPIPEVGGISGGNIPFNQAVTARGPIARLHNFDFDVRFTITSFTFIYVPRNGQSQAIPVNGTLFTNEVKDYMERSKPGDQWIITEIKAVGPDKRTRNLPSVALKLI